MFVGSVAIDEDNKMSRLPIAHELRKTLKLPVETPKMVQDRLVAAIKILSHECDCLHYRLFDAAESDPADPGCCANDSRDPAAAPLQCLGLGRVPSRIWQVHFCLERNA
jgi:hypothetical protein